MEGEGEEEVDEPGEAYTDRISWRSDVRRKDLGKDQPRNTAISALKMLKFY